jgi:hypothetical protein
MLSGQANTKIITAPIRFELAVGQRHIQGLLHHKLQVLRVNNGLTWSVQTIGCSQHPEVVVEEVFYGPGECFPPVKRKKIDNYICVLVWVRSTPLSSAVEAQNE